MSWKIRTFLGRNFSRSRIFPILQLPDDHSAGASTAVANRRAPDFTRFQRVYEMDDQTSAGHSETDWVSFRSRKCFFLIFLNLPNRMTNRNGATMRIDFSRVAVDLKATFSWKFEEKCSESFDKKNKRLESSLSSL